jgi:hypothetical protein
MKKFYALIFFLPLISFAQPTIQQTDLPVVNLIFATGIDPNYTAAIPAGGANQTWNFSNLQMADTGGGRFISSIGTPYESVFAPANLAVYDPVKDEWVYFITNSTGFYTKGLDSAGVNAVFNPPWMWVPVPFTFNDNTYHRGRVQIDTTVNINPYGDVPVRYIRTYDDYFTGDGYGTLILPDTTFLNTLRIKDRQVITDTILANFGFGYMIPPIPGYEPQVHQVHNYRWVRHNGPDVYLLEVQADSLGTTATRAEYQVFSIISVPEINVESQLTPYPNPTSNIIQIDFDKPETGTIEVYNSIGELVKVQSFNSVNRYIMHANMLAHGLYYFHVKTIDNWVRHGRFTVSR